MWERITDRQNKSYQNKKNHKYFQLNENSKFIIFHNFSFLSFSQQNLSERRFSKLIHKDQFMKQKKPTNISKDILGSKHIYFNHIFSHKYHLDFKFINYSIVNQMKSQDRRHSFNQKILRQAIQSIAVRFILNLPPEEKSQKVRLAYHYLKAYYYYIDEVIKEIFPFEDPKKVQQKWFYDQLNMVVSKFIKRVDAEDVLKMMSRYKPTCGAIILNQRQNKVLVIQWNGRYGFPKGGQNQNETIEDCAAREVKQEVGLFIHNKINVNEKVQFNGPGEIPVIFFIVRNFDQNQPIKIQKNELNSAFWMNISDISRNLSKFTQKCRVGWKLFQPNIRIQPKLTMEQFLNVYRDRGPKKKDKKVETEQINPLLNFKLDRESLFAVFKIVESQPQKK